MLWTPWGPIPKDGKVHTQTKSHWLPNAMELRASEPRKAGGSKRSD